MHTNKVWLIFLTAITLVVIWFCWGTTKQLMHFTSLVKWTEVKTIEWEILKIDDDDYEIQAEYSFETQNTTYRSYEVFEDRVYPNLWAAEYELKEMQNKQWIVWFSPEHPKTSSLTKEFPLKSVLSSITLLGLWVYFVWLGFYVTQFRR